MDNLLPYSKNNFETIWLALSNRYYSNLNKYNDIRKVMVSLLEQYFLMIILQDVDFHSHNWELEESDDHISLALKFDNEFAFSNEIIGVLLGVSSDDVFENKTVDSISYFIKVTSL